MEWSTNTHAWKIYTITVHIHTHVHVNSSGFLSQHDEGNGSTRKGHEELEREEGRKRPHPVEWSAIENLLSAAILSHPPGRPAPSTNNKKYTISSGSRTRTQPTGTPIYVDVGELYFEAGSKWSHFHIDELTRYDMKDCPVPLLPHDEGAEKGHRASGEGGRHEIRNETLSSRVFSFFFRRDLYDHRLRKNGEKATRGENCTVYSRKNGY